ncbi:MAG: hypothetical protein ACLGQX_13405 [Acidobacteriota bacterium]
MKRKTLVPRISPRFISSRLCMALALLAAASVLGARQAPAQAAAPTRHRQAWHNTLPSRLISAQVSDGVLTVDGMVGKIDLNYLIDHAGFLYFFEPGVGTAVVSLSPLAGSEKIPNGIAGARLAFTVEGHSFELSDAKPLLSRHKNKQKADIYVRLDTSTVALSRFPQMGYGNTTESPYVWPLSAPEPVTSVKYAVTPPPMPSSVLPRTVDTALALPSSNR